MAIAGRSTVGAALGLALASGLAGTAVAQGSAVTPATMKRIGTVDERYQSFNVEMVEVTGGRFWAPYKAADAAKDAPKQATPAAMDPSLYEYRGPIDLSNARLRKLATALGPSYMRVSGTWANSTYFQDSDGPAPKTAPEGFGSVLTRAEWKGVVDFSSAVDAKIVTSFAISAGVRGADAVWTPVEAKKFLAYTKAVGGNIAAAEMFNEPTFAGMGGAPKGYTAENYGQDFKVFAPYVRQAAPEMKILGPGSVGEETTMAGAPGLPLLRTQDLLAASGPGLDIFSYHFYGGVSKRCAQLGASSQTSPEEALSSEWLGRSEKNEKFYGGLRDEYLAGHPIWLTETGETACGGNPWAKTFVDSFRYLNQLGALAKAGVQVTIHNTLAASDYALIDGKTLEPRPNYWAALLWRRLMGTGVLEAGISPVPNLHVYAHCLRGVPGGVAMLVINADRTAAESLNVPVKGERYSLTAKELTAGSVELNGRRLMMGKDDTLPKMEGAATRAGLVEFGPESITFLAMAGAGNAGCR
jgi:heparanase